MTDAREMLIRHIAAAVADLPATPTSEDLYAACCAAADRILAAFEQQTEWGVEYSTEGDRRVAERFSGEACSVDVSRRVRDSKLLEP